MLRDDRRRVGDQLRPVAANDLIKGKVVALANKLHQTGIRLASNCDPSQAVAPVVAVPVLLSPWVGRSAPLPSQRAPLEIPHPVPIRSKARRHCWTNGGDAGD